MQTRELPRLCAQTLHRANQGVIRPRYDRAAIDTGIVHLGLGNFHRAHQAIYSERLLEQGDRRWGIAGVSLRSAGMRADLLPQDNLYSVHFDDGEARELRIIGSLKDAIVASDTPDRLSDLLTSDSVRLVTITVTEKGYCRASADNDLDFRHPDIERDLQAAAFPCSLVGLIAWTIARRKDAAAKPLVFMSCDNLPSNGKVLKKLVAQFMAVRYPDLVAYLDEAIAFPCSMIDRIVPQTSEEKQEELCRVLGLWDARPIDTEPFSQWVMEETGSPEQPAWENAGVLVTRDVAAYELAKLRLLNGSHSAIAYLGYLSGHATVAAAMADPGLGSFIENLLGEELVPTVPPIRGFDVPDYAARLLARFRNRGLAHQTTQIAMDGSQKLPQRLLEPIRVRLSRGDALPRLALAVAAWIRYAGGRDEAGLPILVKDPLAARFSALRNAGDDADALLAAALDLREVFGEDLPADARFRTALRSALQGIIVKGAAAAMRDMRT